jgi:uncharacterized delta-60 repeat protein
MAGQLTGDLAGAKFAAAAAAALALVTAGARPETARRSTSLDVAYAVAIQRDGKIVAAGRSASGAWRFALARYTVSGILDRRFGRGGKVVTLFGDGRSEAAALAIEGDGRLVVAGRVRVSGIDRLAVARYTAAGRLDTRFGRGGGALTAFAGPKGPNYAWGRAVAIQPNGKIVVAGGSGPPIGPWQLALARFTRGGRPDATFGRGGEVRTRLGKTADAWGVAIQPDGRIVVVGSSLVGQRDVFAVTRYTARGTLDPTFGREGKVLTPFPEWSDANAVALQADGKIVVAGSAESSDFALVRYLPTGRLDPTFGAGGKVLTSFAVNAESEEGALALAIDRKGRIVAAGGSNVESRYSDDFALARYAVDGSLDPTFGTGGKVVTRFGEPTFVQAIAIGADGRIVAAGGGAGHFALARYTPSGRLDPSFGRRGMVTTRFGSG